MLLLLLLCRRRYNTGSIIITIITVADVVAFVAEEFLSTSASQLTYHGLCELSATLKEEQLCVLFRNNHFSTLYKHKVIQDT